MIDFHHILQVSEVSSLLNALSLKCVHSYFCFDNASPSSEASFKVVRDCHCRPSFIDLLCIKPYSISAQFLKIRAVRWFDIQKPSFSKDLLACILLNVSPYFDSLCLHVSIPLLTVHVPPNSCMTCWSRAQSTWSMPSFEAEHLHALWSTIVCSW